MEIITSGLEFFPERLTQKATYSLAFDEPEQIRDQLFVVQITSYNEVKSTSSFFDSNPYEETNILVHVADLKSRQQKSLLMPYQQSRGA